MEQGEKITLRFRSQIQSFKLNDTSPQSEAEQLELTISSAPAQSLVDSTRAIVLSIMRIVLLPPWANGFIPLLALLLAYLFDQHLTGLEELACKATKESYRVVIGPILGILGFGIMLCIGRTLIIESSRWAICTLEHETADPLCTSPDLAADESVSANQPNKIARQAKARLTFWLLLLGLLGIGRWPETRAMAVTNRESSPTPTAPESSGSSRPDPPGS